MSFTWVFAQNDSSASSSTARGKVMVGGNVSGGIHKEITNNYKILSATFSPRIAYFLLKNWAIGININYAYQNFNKSEIITDDVAIGALTRYYIRYKKHGIFPEVGCQYGKSKATYKHQGMYPNYYQDTESSFEQFSYGGGYCYFVNKNVSIEFLYLYLKRTYGKSAFPLNDQLQTVTLGLQFYF